MPPGMESGWIIPNNLRKRHNLIIGNSKTELPKLLKKNNQIELFFHDSLHTYNFMMSECRESWPHISNGGVLISDDIKKIGHFMILLMRHQL